jgi:hypothetical protein
MYHAYQQTLHYCERLGPQEWLGVLAALIVIGLVCMRGFGSRSQY